MRKAKHEFKKMQRLSIFMSLSLKSKSKSEAIQLITVLEHDSWLIKHVIKINK